MSEFEYGYMCVLEIALLGSSFKMSVGTSIEKVSQGIPNKHPSCFVMSLAMVRSPFV